MIGVLAFAFGAGSVATVNPCGFALLPAYLARRLAASDGAPNSSEAVVRAFSAGAVMTFGFVLIFGVGGGAFALGAWWLTDVFPWIGFAIGIVLAVIGMAVLAGRRIGPGLPPPRPNTAVTGLRGDFVFGLGYGAASLSCTLPIFLAVAGTAVTGSVIISALSVIAYALGMGTVVIALALGAALSRGGLAVACKGLLPYMKHISGALLVLSGAYVTYFWGLLLSSETLTTVGDVIWAGERLSGTLRGWVGASEGQTVVYGLLGLLGVVFVWAIRRHIDLGHRYRNAQTNGNGSAADSWPAQPLSTSGPKSSESDTVPADSKREAMPRCAR